MSDHLFAVAATDVATTTDDWYTPRWIFDAARVTFDLDVAAPVDPAMRTVPATPSHRTSGTAAPWCDRWAAHESGMLLLPASSTIVKCRRGLMSAWEGTVVKASAALSTMLAVDFHRPDGTTARLRWPSILAGRGECAAAVAAVARADKYADGGYLVRGVA